MLEHNNKDSYNSIGRLALAYHILKCEPKAANKLAVAENWLTNFLDAHLVGLDEKLSDRISIVSLNYDRLFEFKLFSYYRSRYRGGHGYNCVEGFTVNHLHGRLPLSEAEDPQTMYPSGQDKLTPEDISAYSRDFRLLHDFQDKNNEYEQASKTIYDAAKVVFLGFGFHEPILEKLNINWKNVPDDKFFSTNFNGTVSNAVKSKYPINFFPEDMGVLEFSEALLDNRIIKTYKRG